MYIQDPDNPVRRYDRESAKGKEILEKLNPKPKAKRKAKPKE